MKIKPIIWTMIFLFVVLYFYEGSRYPSRTNPEIYPAFRKIENDALIYIERKNVNRSKYERYKAVIERMNKDAEGYNKYPEYFVSDKEYYDFLAGLGFHLPPYQLEKPPTKEQKDKSMRKQERLFERQSEIIDHQLDKAIRETEQLLK